MPKLGRIGNTVHFIAVRFASNIPFHVLVESVSSTVTSSMSSVTQQESRYSVSLNTQLADKRRRSISYEVPACGRSDVCKVKGEHGFCAHA